MNSKPTTPEISTLTEPTAGTTPHTVSSPSQLMAHMNKVKAITKPW